jgi:L-threonine-O-3-phosphate decarboxylase
MGNGSTELIYLLPRILEKRRALIPVPTYGDYAAASELAGLVVESIPLREERGFAPDLMEIEAALKGDEIVFICTPNNPTGRSVPVADLLTLAVRNPETAFIVDEAFADFTFSESILAGERPANLIVLRSFTKFYAIPGLRLGAVVAERRVIERLRTVMPPWSVNTLAQTVGTAALRDSEYADRTRRYVSARREELTAEISEMPGLCAYAGTANFILVRSDRKDIPATELARLCLADGIAIRICDNFAGLDERFFRIAVRTAEENCRLCNSLRKALGVSEGFIRSR